MTDRCPNCDVLTHPSRCPACRYCSACGKSFPCVQHMPPPADCQLCAYYDEQAKLLRASHGH